MEKLKQIIQTMVVSNVGRPMTIPQLDKLFKSTEGYYIPYEKHGFKHLDAMLRTMSDAVQLNGLGCSAFVLPVITQNTKQIRGKGETLKINSKKRKAEPSNSTAKKVKFETPNTTGLTVKKVKLEPSSCTGFTAKKVKLEPALCTKSARNHVSNSNITCNPRTDREDNNIVIGSCLTMAKLKKIIRAIVISNPGSPLTVAQLAKDFKHFEGIDIPYRDHGFPQLDALLQSIPDIVKLNGQGPSALVYAVTSEKSKHIDEMISKQKNNGKSRFNKNQQNYRRSRWSQSTNTRNGLSSNEHGHGNFSNRNGNGNLRYDHNAASYASHATNGSNTDRISMYGNNASSHPYVRNGYGMNAYNFGSYPRNAPYHPYTENNYYVNRDSRDGYSVPGHSYARQNCYATNGYDAIGKPGNGNYFPGYSYAPTGYTTNSHNTSKYPGYKASDHSHASNSCHANRKSRDGYNVSHHPNAPRNDYATNGYNANRNRGNRHNVANESLTPNGNNANINPAKDSKALVQSSATNCCTSNSFQNLKNSSNDAFFTSVMLTDCERKFLKILHEVLVEKSLKRKS